ncbi:hypothetical protein ACXJY6_01175 [Vibrio sp. RC27]
MSKLIVTIKNEYNIHKWEYLSFSIVVFLSSFVAYITKLIGLDQLIQYFTADNFVLSEQIRNAALEHFAPDTLGYGTVLLYLFVAIFRITFGTNKTAISHAEKYILNPLINFYTILCRAMIGGLFALALIIFVFDFSSKLFILFLFMCIYPIGYVLVVRSFKEFINPMPKFKFDNGWLRTRLVGFVLLLLLPISTAAVYLIDLIGKAIVS